jgi:hypothetical protein
MGRAQHSLLPVLDEPAPYMESARILEDAGSLSLAEMLLVEAERQFPDHEVVCLRNIEFIDRHHGPELALARCVRSAHRFPRHHRVWANLVRRHREAGRLQTAESVLGEALERNPDSIFLLVESALVARARGDLHETERRWRTAVDRYPRWPEAILAHNTVRSSLAARALDIALEQQAEPPDTGDGYVSSGELDAASTCDLFRRFVSLGDDPQFGSLQRFFGAGTFGLFRYSGITAADLVRALNTDLAEIIEAGDATPIPAQSDWHLHLPQAGFRMQTLVEPADPGVFLAQMRRRLRYLAMQLLAQLRDGRMTFVFKAYDPGEEEISALHAAVRRHGPAALLCVRRGGPGRPSGSAEARGDGLWVGHIGPGGPMDKAFRDAWVAICKAVAEALPPGR